MKLSEIIDLETHPVTDAGYMDQCAQTLADDGVLVLPNLLKASALAAMQAEAIAGQDQAYFCAQNHSVYLTPHDQNHSDDHPANRQVVSSQG